MSVSDVAQWLEQLGLGQYAQSFEDNDIDFEVLPRLTDENFKELGLTIGHRVKLKAAIENLSPVEPPTPTDLTVTQQLKIQPADAERRQLTVMFCDLAGSTALSTRLDPEDYRDVIRAYQDACAGVIARYDGYVAKFMGDGVLAYFGWPRGHENDAERAISAGLGVAAAVGDMAQAEGEAEPLAVRIGIATGPVVVGDIVGEGAAQEAAVTGETPNLAARLQEIAQPNSVVIAETTHQLAGGLFAYEALGGRTLKGIDGETHIWRVSGEQQVESRFAAAHRTALTPLIGREEELALLSRRWERAKSGDGQVVLLSGEPGIGKSRLTQALRDWIGDEPHIRLLHQCSPHHTSSALYPITSRLERAAGIDARDPVDAKLDKLEDLLAQAGQPTGEIMPFFAALLSIPADARYPLPELTPQEQKVRTLAALVDQLASLAALQPVLFVFEDAHWIDPTSLELMEQVVERITHLPVLILVTFRPEFTAPWIGLPHVTLQSLNRLDIRACIEIAEQLCRDASLSPEVLARLVEKTDGVPLFVEELTRSVLDARANRGAPDGAASARHDTDIVIPATLQDALEARLDRSPAVREVAQIGAAIGREFPYDLIAQVASLPAGELAAALNDLVGTGLIFARGTPPDASYTFKHALVRDTAYDSMVRSKRHETHERIAGVLAESASGGTAPETIAEHFENAGLFSEAADYWFEAAQAAVAKSANVEAINFCQRSTALIEQLPETEDNRRRLLATLTLELQPTLPTVGYSAPAAEQLSARALALCREVGSSEELFRILYFCFGVLHAGGNSKASLEAALEYAEQARESGDEAAIMVGHRLCGTALFTNGRPAEALTHLQQVIDSYVPERHDILAFRFAQDVLIAGLCYAVLCTWMLGWPERAMALVDRTWERVRKLDHPSSTVLAAFHLDCFMRTLVGSQKLLPDGVDAILREFKNNPFLVGFEKLLDAAARFDRDEIDLAAFEQSIHAHTESLHTVWFTGAMYLRAAQVCLTRGDIENADRLIAEADSLNKKGFDVFVQPEVSRMQGECHLARGDLDAADDCISTSLQITRQNEVKMYELRATMSLAHLRLAQGRPPAEARVELATIYDWFTEGFDTPDLKAAKALLDELS
jgi:class 3 adenylate cyclase/tetratricopeptide (TPR) repeat protein